MATILFGLPLGDIVAAVALVFGAWAISIAEHRFGLSRALPYFIVAGVGLARLALDAAGRPDVRANAGAAGLAGAMTAGIVFAAIGDIALVLALYGRHKWGSVLSQFVTSHAARPPQSQRMPPLWLAVLLVYGAAVPPDLPADTPPLFGVLGIAMLVVGALVPVLAALPAALREVREIRATQRARRMP